MTPDDDMNSIVNTKYPVWAIRQIILVPKASYLIFPGKNCPIFKMRRWDFRYYDDRIKTFLHTSLENHPQN